MLKRLTIWLLMFAVLAANFSCAFVYVGFKVNQPYIAKTLCINRSRPWLHCNGKCYFMRKIKQAEENEKKQAERDGSVRLEVFFFQEPYQIAFIEPVILETHKSTFTRYTFQYNNRYLSTIFRPPKQAV
jgi:hypothetical protein